MNLGMAEATIATVPCHGMVIPMEEKKEMDKPCSACIDSEEQWSQNLIFSNQEVVLQDIRQAFTAFAWELFVLPKIDIAIVEQIHDPPDHMASQNSHLIVTKSTIFRL